MVRFILLNEIEEFNQKSNFNESIDALKDFLTDESTEFFLKGEFFLRPDANDLLISKKHFVENIDKSKIEVRSNEHTPPHFHILIAEYEASYEILTCKKMEGNIPNKYEKKLVAWHKYGGKERLIERWNETRPTGCPVGKITS